jgi:hypothetical protein
MRHETSLSVSHLKLFIRSVSTISVVQQVSGKDSFRKSLLIFKRVPLYENRAEAAHSLRTGQPEFDSRLGQGYFLSPRPDRLCGPLSLLSNGYR